MGCRKGGIVGGSQPGRWEGVPGVSPRPPCPAGAEHVGAGGVCPACREPPPASFVNVQ